MPIYEYVCDACGYGFERIQSFSDAPLATCPECSGSVRRVISPVGVIFKGSGWYINDSKRQLSAKASPKPGEGNGSKDSSGGSGDGATTAKDSGSTAATDGGSTSSDDAKPAASGSA